MGLFFNKKVNINTGDAWALRIFAKLEGSNYHQSVVTWSKICSAFIPEQLESINKIQGNILSYESIKFILKNELGSLKKRESIDAILYKTIEIAYRKLIIYYLFHTLEIGDDNFLIKNKISKEDFIKQTIDIFNLSKIDIDYIDEYISKNNIDIKEQKSIDEGEYSVTQYPEIESLVMGIYNSTGFIVIKTPSRESIELVLQDVKIKKTIFDNFLQKSRLIESKIY